MAKARRTTTLKGTKRKATPRRIYQARCLCGLRVLLHRDEKNRTVSCEEAARNHARASRRQMTMYEALRASLEG